MNDYRNIFVLYFLTVFGPWFAEGSLQSYGIMGRIVCQAGSPFQGVLVQLWDLDAMPRLDEDDLLGEIVTDENGYFRISGETKEWSWIDPAIELRIPFNYPTLATAKCCIYETWSNYGMKARVGRRLPKNYIQEGHFDPNLRNGYFDVGTIVVPTYLTGGTFSDDEIMWQKNWEGSCCFLPRMA